MLITFDADDNTATIYFRADTDVPVVRQPVRDDVLLLLTPGGLEHALELRNMKARTDPARGFMLHISKEDKHNEFELDDLPFDAVDAAGVVSLWYEPSLGHLYCACDGSALKMLAGSRSRRRWCWPSTLTAFGSSF